MFNYLEHSVDGRVNSRPSGSGWLGAEVWRKGKPPGRPLGRYPNESENNSADNQYLAPEDLGPPNNPSRPIDCHALSLAMIRFGNALRAVTDPKYRLSDDVDSNETAALLTDSWTRALRFAG